MNIWYFCMDPNVSFGNTQRAPSIHIRATIDSLQELGHQVQHFLYGDELGWAEAKIRQRVRESKRTNVLLRKARPLLSGLLLLYQNMIRDRSIIEPIFRENPIDLVYERLFPSKSAVSACARKYKIPIIVESNEPTGQNKQYRGSPLHPFVSHLERKILQRADAVTVVSTPLKRHYEKLGVSSQKIFVLPNGVDEKQFSSDNVSRNIRMDLGLDGKMVVGFVGNIHRYHGAELFLPLARALSRVRDDIHFLIIGGGPGPGQLQAALDRESLNKFFTLVGPVPNLEVPDYIAAMDICLLPHFMWYGSPMKIFEYGAMGKAIIAPNLENIREILCHGKTAFLFEPENLSTLAQAIQELASNMQLRVQLGARVRKHILANHTWTKNAERIIGLVVR